MATLNVSRHLDTWEQLPEAGQDGEAEESCVCGDDGAGTRSKVGEVWKGLFCTVTPLSFYYPRTHLPSFTHSSSSLSFFCFQPPYHLPFSNTPSLACSPSSSLTEQRHKGVHRQQIIPSAYTHTRSPKPGKSSLAPGTHAPWPSCAQQLCRGQRHTCL